MGEQNGGGAGVGAGPESSKIAVDEQEPAAEWAADPTAGERVQQKGNKFVLVVVI